MAENEKNNSVETENTEVKDENADNAASTEQTNEKASKKASKTAKISNAELEKLNELNLELTKKVSDLNDRLLRTVAEYDNFRKRSQKEKDSIYTDSKVDVIGKFLPIVDNFERASAATADFDAYKKGIEMTVKQLTDALAALGVEAFGEKGDEFDARLHNVVMQSEDEDLPENSIAEVFVKGYKLGDRVIRHATVKVAN